VAIEALTEPSKVNFHLSARLLGVASTLITLALAITTALGINQLAHHKITSGIWWLSLTLIARSIVVIGTNEWATSRATRIKQFWRSRSVQHLRRPRLEGQRSRGDLALAVEHASDGPVLEMLSVSARTSVLGLGIIFWSAGWLSTLIAVALMAVAVPFYQRAGKRSERLADDYSKRRATLESRQLELLAHAPELRALGAVRYGADEIGAISRSEHTIALRAIRVALESSLVTEFLSGVSIGLVAMVVGFRLLEGHISLEHALIAVLATSEIFLAIRRFGVEFHRRENALASLSQLVQEEEIVTSTGGDVVLRASELITRASDQVFNFEIRQGQRVVVLGPSGSGKTTLLQTLVGWRAPAQGDVQCTALPIGYVSVESEFVSGTFYENLVLSAPIPEHEVVSCMQSLGLDGTRFANLHESLLADGRGLSTGEKVRLALVRCVLAKPSVIILDDIGGVIDAASRQMVRELISRQTATIVEASVDDPLLDSHDVQIDVDAL
jgi:ABC-type transport system involved in cytochrome bd biosynthesis fused ATPase/permease subunit